MNFHLALTLSLASAQSVDRVRIGVLTDMTGPFSDQVGQGSVTAATLAAEDFAKEGGGPKVEILSGDHQNKPDVGVAIARRWLDQDDVSAIVDLPNSGVAIPVAGLMKERNRTALASSSMSSDLTGKLCAPTTVQWVSDTWAQGSATARALAARGKNQWYFLTVDYALGQALERDATKALVAAGGKVVGSIRHPLNTADFSSALLTAQGFGDLATAGSTTRAMVASPASRVLKPFARSFVAGEDFVTRIARSRTSRRSRAVGGGPHPAVTVVRSFSGASIMWSGSKLLPVPRIVTLP